MAGWLAGWLAEAALLRKHMQRLRLGLSVPQMSRLCRHETRVRARACVCVCVCVFMCVCVCAWMCLTCMDVPHVPPPRPCALDCAGVTLLATFALSLIWYYFPFYGAYKW